MLVAKKTLLCLSFALLSSAAWADSLDKVNRLINAERQNYNLSKLVVNAKLSEAAKMHAEWMATTGVFSHLEGNKPVDTKEWVKSRWHPLNRAIQAGYVDFSVTSQPNANHYVSEIIAYGTPKSGPGRFDPKVIVDGWIKSSGHHKVMLGDFKEFGVAKKVRKGHVYWVVVFGNPE